MKGNLLSEYESYFDIEEKKRVDSPIICKSNVTKKNAPCVNQMVYMPKLLLDTLKKNAIGPISPVLVGLVEYALSVIDKNDLTVIFQTKQQD